MNVKRLRQLLGVTQERMAWLTGVTFISIHRWENGHLPANYGAVVMELLGAALARHAPSVVTRELEEAKGVAVDVVRRLVWLEKKKP